KHPRLNIDGKPLEQWVAPQQLADRFPISKRTLERMRADDTGPPFSKVEKRSFTISPMSRNCSRGKASSAQRRRNAGWRASPKIEAATRLNPGNGSSKSHHRVAALQYQFRRHMSTRCALRRLCP